MKFHADYALATNTHRGVYHIIWNNGVWKIFDIHKYEDCEIFPTFDLALKALYA